MSCRIERLQSEEDFVVLRVSGRIHGQHVDVLRELVEREKGGVAIDLTEVILVDREAVRLLALSEEKGVELRNCPAYVREWVARERTGTGGEVKGSKGGEGMTPKIFNLDADFFRPNSEISIMGSLSNLVAVNAVKGPEAEPPCELYLDLDQYLESQRQDPEGRTEFEGIVGSSGGVRPTRADSASPCFRLYNPNVCIR
jgi:hypothetical protein